MAATAALTASTTAGCGWQLRCDCWKKPREEDCVLDGGVLYLSEDRPIRPRPDGAVGSAARDPAASAAFSTTGTAEGAYSENEKAADGDLTKSGRRRRVRTAKFGLDANDLQLSTKLSMDLGLADPGRQGEAAASGGAAAASSSAPGGLPEKRRTSASQMWMLPSLRSRMEKFREGKVGAVVAAAPDEVEQSRRLVIQRVYDFYTVADRKIRVRKMTQDVIHTRAQLQFDEEEQEDEAGEMVDYASEASDSSSDDMMGTGSRDMLQLSTSSESSKGSKQRPGPSSPRVGRRSPKGDRSFARWPSGREDKLDSSRRTRQRAEAALGQTEPGPRLTRASTIGDPEVLVRWGVIVGQIMHSRVLDFTTVAGKAALKRRFQVDGKVQRGFMLSSVRDRAKAVVSQALVLAKKVSKEQDQRDHEWLEEDLLSTLFSKEYVDMLALLANMARKILSVQPTLAEVTAPCRIFGDIHGQLRDLLLLFHAFGSPADRDAPSFVFNGDFVDRGSHQLEVVGLLLALKVLLPERVWLVRGNHEDRYMNQKYGFAEECTKKLGSDLGPKVFELIQGAFEQLPLACLVAERALVVHGGVGDGAWTLHDVQAIKKPIRAEEIHEPDKYWIFNMLWSDPIEDDDDQRPMVFGVHESPRGGICAQFGWDITKTFCARNGLSLVVRSHQSKKESLGFDIMHENLLVRVFSARDYEGHGNDGAVLFIDRREDGMLLARPQILRSTTKARKEERRREEELEGLGMESRKSRRRRSSGSNRGVSRMSSDKSEKGAPVARLSSDKSERRAEDAVGRMSSDRSARSTEDR